MAINANIPLQAQTLDLASPLATLIQLRERNEDRQMMRRQEARQQEQFDLNNEQTRQAIQANAAQLRQVMNSQATQDYVTDALTVRNLLGNNDAQNAGILMQSMMEKYKGTPYAQGLDTDLQNLQSGNIEPVLRSIDDDLTMVQQVRQVLQGGGGGGFRLLSRQEIDQAGLSPDRAYQINTGTNQISAIGGGPVATTTVNLPTPTDKATEKFGEGMGERASARIEQASNAQQQNTNLMRMAEALDAGARTGLGQETLLNLQNFAQSIFGLPISENAGEQEVIRALGNRLVMEVRNPTSGLGLPGATSNRDLDFLTASVPNLARTPQGNALLIEYLMKQNQFKLDLVNEQQRIIDENNGAVPSNLDTQLMRFANNYQFLDDQFRQEVEQAMQAAPPAAQQNGQQRVGRFIIEAQ